MENGHLQKLIKLMSYYAQFDEEELTFLHEYVPMRTYSKGELILKAGKVADTIYFILEGCIRMFYEVDGVRKTSFFYTEGRFCCAGESLTLHVPARENLQAIEETRVLLFDERILKTLMVRSPKYELMARIATEDELIHYQRMLASFVTQSAEQRYVELMETNASLFMRVPQQYIASYLGVSPETLSRIKKRVTEKKLLH